MRATIGNRLLRQIEPRAKPFEVHDQRMTGFLLRVQPSGTMTYLAQYRRGRRVTLGRANVMTPQDAREEAKKVLGDAMRGIDPVAEKREAKDHSLASFLDEEYGAWARAHLKSADEILARTRSSFPKFLKTKLRDIEPRQVEKWRTARISAGRKPATINRDLACLRAALSKAVEWGFLPAHPLAQVKNSKIDTNRAPRYLSTEEKEKLYTALDEREHRLRMDRASGNQWRAIRGIPIMRDLFSVRFADHLKPMVLISLNTGLRRGEFFNLRWEDIDFEQQVLTVQGEGAKSGKTRHVPMNGIVVDVLGAWWDQFNATGGLIFPSKSGEKFDNVNKAWRGVLHDAGISDFRWHDLRHTFASWLMMKSVDLNTVRELLGHSDIKMTLRYAHLAPEHKANAVARLA